MKKVIIPLFLTGFLVGVTAQEQLDYETAPKNWFHQSIDNGTYGVNTEKAYQFLKKTGRTPQTVIVGILDSGVDAEHEDLKDVMWVNRNEIAGNGVDDDKNGHVDDIHGWNFLGNADGTNVNGDNLEITRLYAQYRSKFENLKERKINRNIKKYPEEYDIYLEGKELIEKNSSENNSKLLKIKEQQEQLVVYKSQFAEAFKNVKGIVKNENVTSDDLKSFLDKNKTGDQRTYAALGILYDATEKAPNKTINLNEIETGFNDLLDQDIDNIKDYINYLESKTKYHYNPDLNTRKIVGDNYNNKKESNYGNNDVKGPDALHGTHVAGLVAAVRHNGIGMDGVADHVQIMSVRVVPDGDERDKDIANGIIYAVDNGAKILNMSFGKKYSPDKSVVDDAVRYAEKKGALLMHAAGNDGEDLNVELHYPINVTKNDTIATNWITVGANTTHKDRLAASFSNYGSKTVDLFSPGTEIYSTTPNNQYKVLQGTSMATPIASGVAALIWSYYPELTAHELRNILLKSVNIYKGIVPTPTEKDKKSNQSFANLSTTGGVIDAYNAAKLADEYVKSKK
ncbi:MAG: S8 family serine peptidase [Flavobacteriales bacterium]